MYNVTPIDPTMSIYDFSFNVSYPELLGLTWNDIDMDNCTLSINKATLYLPERGVFQDTPKNESSNRVLKLPDTVIRHLREYRAAQAEERLKLGELWVGAGHVFTQWNGLPMHPDTITQWFGDFIKRYNQSVMERVDLTKGQKETQLLPAISPHSLRHTNASLLIADGVNIRTVAARLGHAQTSTTTNIYSHAIKTSDAIASDALESRLLKQHG